jgi:hypothetical protein
MTGNLALPIPINLAVEDLLSEAIARRLLAQRANGYLVGAVYGRGGYGYLRSTVRQWNQASRGGPIFLLTDLDRIECPPELLQDWMGTHTINPNFIFRVAVTEVEAWLLADAPALAEFLDIEINLIPQNPENLPDPKRELIQLATHSPHRSIRLSLVPRKNSTATQGPNYNDCLTNFVEKNWNPERARQSAQSLDKAINALTTFVPDWGA